ncbi:MAG: InlB B-repeat-containing protein, partial [Lachnospiraceae bacterium]|nr:InlB B-repeat-containing protein [Lachnospiraceae bacterium]
LQAAYHTADEIQEFIAQEKAAKTDSITYRTEPDLKAPYSAGALSEDTRNAAASMLRQIRFIAGLPYDVAVNEEYSHLSQSAALLNYINNALSPNPSQPEGMSEELFHQGCEGAAHSNIAYADDPSKTLNDTLLSTWMAENGNGSSSTLENRRRILNPSLNQVGFGAVKGEDGIYSAMYTTETAKARAERPRIAWPAQNMPVEYFDSSSPWSVTTGELLDASDIRVTLTREADAKTWTFSADAADGAFDVDNDRAAQESVLIFRPEAVSDYADGDSFQIEITKNEKPYIRYTVNFFSISNEEEKLTAPKASIADGEVVAKESKLVLTSAENAAIYYTLDGTTPTAESTLYTEPILLETDITVQAVAIKEGCADSDIAAFTYTVEEALPLRYTVTFVSDDGVVLLAASVIENENIELPDPPVKEGFVFENWYKETACENKWDFENDTVTEDLTLYAKWTVLSFTVSFDLQGQGTPIPSISADHGTLLTAPDAPTAEGYVFEGWYKEPECKTVWDFAAELVSADATLYAKWTEEAVAEAAYVVTFDMQGVGTQLEPVSVVKGELLTAPAEPSAEGYAFAEWYREADCTNAWNFETDPVTEDLVLYAKWVQTDDENLSIRTVQEAADEEVLIDLSAEQTATLIKDIKPKVYNGKPYEPNVNVSIFNGKKKVTLKKGKDYTVKYENNTNAGVDKAVVTVTGIGSYKGSVKKNFTITPKSVKKLKIITGSKLTNSGNPTIVIYDGTIKLNNGGFLAKYIDAQDPKKAKLELTAKENTNYTGAVTVKLTVYDVTNEYYINSAKLEITGDTTYTGKAITRTVKMNIGDTELRNNKDYKVQYQNNTNAGTAVMIITGKGKYKGKIVNTFNIGKADINKYQAAENIPQHVTIADISPKTYNGKEQKPSVTIKTIRSKKLVVNKDYTVAYSNNIHSGTAMVTIKGIGNNCNGSTTIKFKIEPQEIKKSSVKVTKATDKVPSKIVLTYNKKELVEYTDYAITNYSEQKNKQVSVTIQGIGDFKGEVTKKLRTEIPEEDFDGSSAAVSTNINGQNYGDFEGSDVRSYLFQNDDNTFVRVEYIGNNNVCIESYTPDYTFISQEIIKMELPKFGGFYAGKDYYFLAFGQRNPNKDDTLEVLRVIKYDKKWNRIDATRLFGANTLDPFKNGSLRMAECGDILYIRSCHQMYNTHQANIALSIQISNMEIKQQLTGVYNLGWNGYVSHSYNQYLLIDDNDLLSVDHGDAYPRSVVMVKYNKKANEENALGGNQYVHVLPMGGSGAYTGVSVGGFEASDTAYLTAGNSVDQKATPYSTGTIRNIFVTSTQKNNFSSDGTAVHWITDHKYIEYTDVKGNPQKVPEAVVTTPHLVKLNGSEFMLIWSETISVIEDNKPVRSTIQKSILLNGNGEPISGIYSFEGPLSDCKPIVVNGNILWYYTNKSAPVFYTLNPEDVRKVPR